MEGQAREQHIREVQAHGREGCGIRADPRRGKRDERHGEQPRDIAPQDRVVDSVHLMKNDMVIHPVDRDEQEAERIAEQDRAQIAQIALFVADRLFELQYHDGDDDG